jgi:hypothetical protein
MDDNHNGQLFLEIDPPQGLFSAIVGRIMTVRRRVARLRLAVLCVVVAASGTVLVPIAGYITEEFRVSGFYDYMSLVFSDYSVAFHHWQEISLSVTESFPSIATLLTLAVSVAFAWSIREAIRNARLAIIPASGGLL